MNPKDERFVIYGAGTAGKCILRKLRKIGVTPLAFLDVKQDGSQNPIEEVRLFHPDSPEASQFKRGATLLLGIFNTLVDSRKLTSSLQQKGFLRVRNFVQFIREMESEHGWDANLGLQTYWLESVKTLERCKKERLRLLALVGDQESRDVVDGLLRYRETGDDTSYPTANLSDQYFPEDIIPLATALPFSAFIDCGAFTGDTVIQLTGRTSRANILQLQEVISFEPDPDNYLHLTETTRRLSSDYGHISFRNIPCAVWNKSENLCFQAEGMGNSALRSEGKIRVQAVSIDESVVGVKGKAYLKMDLEGSETEALHGARNFIRENKPILAIACYHTCNHLWEIPHLISNWNLGYRLFLRQHGHNGMDTVLYAIAN